MKFDKLEKFISENRNAFDDRQPGPEVWDKIIKRQPKTVALNWTNILLRVAAIAVIFVSGYIFIDYLSRENGSAKLADSEMIEPDDAMMVQDLLEAEYYYTAQIDEKKEEFYCLTAGNSMLREDVNMEMDELDQVFKNLKEDLNDNADNEEVVSAMIRNYRLKLEILEEILTQLRSAEENNDCHESKSVNM